jgi:hypothetical protein
MFFLERQTTSMYEVGGKNSKPNTKSLKEMP